MFSPARYPYTYAYDYLRECVDNKISRADASRIVQEIIASSRHPLGPTPFVFGLAEKYFELCPEENPTIDELIKWRGSEFNKF